MKLMAISLFLIFLIPTISAISFSLETPSEVKVNDEFTVSIISQETDTHDVKIFVEDPSSSPKTISEILNLEEEWQNSYYYVKQAFPQQTIFQLKINSPGNWQICSRLRKSSPSTPTCNDITVVATDNTEKIAPNKKTDNQEDSIDNNSNDTVADNNKAEQSQNNNLLNQFQPAPFPNNEKLILGLPTNTQENIPFTTKQQKTTQYIILSFTAFTIIIIILLALRKL
jgi:predicted RND superfamily exporter protein